MRVFTGWAFMTPSDRFLNAMSRPFGWDILAERDYGWMDFKNYYGPSVERSAPLGVVTINVWVGPMHLTLCRM